MTRKIIEVSGLDYSGKSTQAELLTMETQTSHVHNFGSYIGYSNKLPTHLNPQDLFNWWFVDSSFDEMSEALLDAYNQRKAEAEVADLDIAVVERGESMLRAQIAAAFATRNDGNFEDFVDQTDDKISAFVQQDSKKAEIGEVVLSRSRTMPSVGTRTFNKANNGFSAAQNEFYGHYLSNTERALGHYAAEKTIIMADKPAVDVQNTIRASGVLDPILLPQLFTSGQKFIGLGGLSETGKGAIAQELANRYGFTRLKIGYFNETQRDQAASYGDPQRIALDIVHFLATNRHLERATLESFHGSGVSLELKALLGERWYAVNVVLDDVERQARLIEEDPNSNTDELIAHQQLKDTMKVNAGVEHYQDIADITVDNSGTLEEAVRIVIEGIERL